MQDRDLGRLMSQAAYRATVECMERGYSRSDKVTKDSSRAAAEEVYRQHRGLPEAVPVALPAVPVPDPVRERIDRDWQGDTLDPDPDDDVPF